MSAPALPISELNEAVKHLQRPFSAAAIRIKPQTVMDGRGGGKVGLVTYYLDARLVVERLNTVVGPASWSDAYRVLVDGPHAAQAGIPVECSLTVLNITRVDVGQIAPGAFDEKAWKSAYSDALKRAAVKFRIGSYLYGGLQVWAEVKVGRNGKAQGFTDAGRDRALGAYADHVKSKRILDLFGEAFDHGDVEQTVIGAEDIADGGEPDAVPEADPDAVAELVASLYAEGHTAERVEKGLATARSQNWGKLHPDYVAAQLEKSRERLAAKDSAESVPA